MTDSAPRCAGCGRDLDPDDRFCRTCGRPVLTVDDEATLVIDEGGAAHSTASEPVEAPAPTRRPSGTAFTDRFRRMLGEEYDIITLLGQGGFARVYKARDQRLDRIVAIKVIRPEVIDTELYWESFRKEGIALAQLRHPAIVPIYDIRERNGLIYYIMPFVEGTTLEERMARGKLPPYESRRILSELANALGAAHRAKMVHLDIKPANVFLEGDLGKVLLMDFGTAMMVPDQVDDSLEGPVVGTPEYMSPEQARGLPEIDHRSDIYSLGALGYSMLMGRPPFSGHNAREILEKHVKEAPVSIRRVNPTIPKEFADAVMKCLEKDPWERFSTTKELDAALQAVTFRSTQEVSAIRDESSGVSPTMVAVIGCVALLVGLLMGLAIG